MLNKTPTKGKITMLMTGKWCRRPCCLVIASSVYFSSRVFCDIERHFPLLLWKPFFIYLHLDNSTPPLVVDSDSFSIYSSTSFDQSKKVLSLLHDHPNATIGSCLDSITNIMNQSECVTPTEVLGKG